MAILAAGSGDALMRLDVNLWVWTLVIFLAVVLILWRGGWKMMIAKLDARDEAIRGAIERAKKAREDAEQLLAEQKAALDAARREAAEMLQNVQQEASRERRQVLEQARAEYERIVQRGREQIENETRAALEKIRVQVADLSLEVAGRLLRVKLDPAAHRDLAERFVAEIEQGRGGAPSA